MVLIFREVCKFSSVNTANKPIKLFKNKTRCLTTACFCYTVISIDHGYDLENNLLISKQFRHRVNVVEVVVITVTTKLKKNRCLDTLRV